MDVLAGPSSMQSFLTDLITIICSKNIYIQPLYDKNGLKYNSNACYL